MNVIVLDVLTQDEPQVPLAGDQHPVQALAAGAGNPPLRDRVRPRRLDRSLDDPHAGRGEDRVEGRGELGVAVPEQELDAVSVILEGHQQVACLLGYPVGAENRVTICDLGILADQAPEPVSAENPDVCARSRWMRTTGRRSLLQRPDEQLLLDTKLVTSDTVIPASLTILAALADLCRTDAVSLESGRVGCRGESE
jgi:hypothetical protein